MDIVKYDLLCGGQEFSQDFCKCDMSQKDKGLTVIGMMQTLITLGYVMLAAWISVMVGSCLNWLFGKRNDMEITEVEQLS